MLNMLWAGNDGSRDLLGGVSWKYGSSDERAAGFGEGGGDSGSHNAWDHVVLVRDLKDRGESRTHRGVDGEDAAGDQVPLPKSPDGHPAGQYIATNMIANMLGLGWAATPAGVKGDGRAGETGG